MLHVRSRGFDCCDSSNKNSDIKTAAVADNIICAKEIANTLATCLVSLLAYFRKFTIIIN